MGRDDLEEETAPLEDTDAVPRSWEPLALADKSPETENEVDARSDMDAMTGLPVAESEMRGVPLGAALREPDDESERESDTYGLLLIDAVADCIVELEAVAKLDDVSFADIVRVDDSKEVLEAHDDARGDGLKDNAPEEEALCDGSSEALGDADAVDSGVGSGEPVDEPLPDLDARLDDDDETSAVCDLVAMGDLDRDNSDENERTDEEDALIIGEAETSPLDVNNVVDVCRRLETPLAEDESIGVAEAKSEPEMTPVADNELDSVATALKRELALTSAEIDGDVLTEIDCELCALLRGDADSEGDDEVDTDRGGEIETFGLREADNETSGDEDDDAVIV